MILVIILLIVFFSFLLIKSADLVIIAIRRISQDTQTKTFAVSAIILALGTSFPELFVGITSSIEKSPNLSLGVVIGSNIANIALVGSVAAAIVGKIKVRGDYFRHDVWMAGVAGFLPMFLLLDGSLNRVDGIILLSMYMAYATGFFKRRYIQIGSEQQEEGFVYRFIRQFNHISSRKTREFARLFVGIAIMLFSADAIVKLSVILGQTAGVPLFVIGLIVVAAGTSLPEFAFSLRSLQDHEPSMFFGNLLGSIIANSTLVVGLSALINPIAIFAFNEYFVAVFTFALTFILFWLFIRSKHRLDRWEAVVLILIYAVFVIATFI